jgi:hypothetical protein
MNILGLFIFDKLHFSQDNIGAAGKIIMEDPYSTYNKSNVVLAKVQLIKPTRFFFVFRMIKY